jgi:hypothetical protein
MQTNLLMFYKAKVAVCSESRTKHINAMWEPRRIFLMLNLVVRKVTARLQKAKNDLPLHWKYCLEWSRGSYI